MSQLPPTIKYSVYLLFFLAASSLICIVCPFLFVWGGYIQGFDGNNNPNDAPVGLLVVAIIYLIFMMLFGAGGLFLIQRKPWARRLTIALAILSLLILPPWSTIIGIIILVLVFSAEGKQAFQDILGT